MKFQPDLSSLSAGEISQQLALSDNPKHHQLFETKKIHLQHFQGCVLTVMLLNGYILATTLYFYPQVIFIQTPIFKTRMTCLNTSSTLDSGLSGGWKEGLLISIQSSIIGQFIRTMNRTCPVVMHVGGVVA